MVRRTVRCQGARQSPLAVATATAATASNNGNIPAVFRTTGLLLFATQGGQVRLELRTKPK